MTPPRWTYAHELALSRARKPLPVAEEAPRKQTRTGTRIQTLRRAALRAMSAAARVEDPPEAIAPAWLERQRGRDERRAAGL